MRFFTILFFLIFTVNLNASELFKNLDSDLDCKSLGGENTSNKTCFIESAKLVGLDFSNVNFIKNSHGNIINLKGLYRGRYEDVYAKFLPNFKFSNKGASSTVLYGDSGALVLMNVDNDVSLIIYFSEIVLSGDSAGRVIELIVKNDWSNSIRSKLSQSSHTDYEHFNDGKNNIGYFNFGNNNIGHFNLGDGNTGILNEGSGNKGAYNSGSKNTGNFNKGSNNIGSYILGDKNIGDRVVGTGMISKECRSRVKRCKLLDLIKATY